MMGDETNGNVLDSNMSKGHGHQSSPSHPPLGRGDGGVRHDTRVHVHCTKYMQKESMHAPQVPRPARAQRALARSQIDSVGVWTLTRAPVQAFPVPAL